MTLPAPSTAAAQSHHLLHPKYRADIDGLRAVAVLSVVGFHAFPLWLRGGFVGVDIFFVISGFLIATIIFGSLERNSFSFIEFYSRRVRRIFPALLLVLVAAYVFGWFALLADEYKQLGKHLAAGAGFVSNLVLWSESSYFDNAAETKPLLHLWSLGIEEQFYIVWPLLLWGAWKKRFNLLTIALLIAVISFSLNLYGVHRDATATFYAPQTRFWELLLGSLLAWLSLYRIASLSALKHRLDSWLSVALYAQPPALHGKALRDVQSVAGGLFIAAAVLSIDKGKAFHGYWALLPTIGALLMISAGPHAWGNRVLLSNRVLVWFGGISFPLYLWHWPLLSFARIIEGGPPAWEIRFGVVVLSIVLAWMTTRLVERPLRFGRFGAAKTSGLLLVMLLLGYVGYNTYQRDGLAFRVKKFAAISKAAGEWEYPGTLKAFDFENRKFYRQESGRKEITLFIGDSNIEQYYVRMDALIKDQPHATNGIVFATDGGCLPIKDASYDDDHRHCSGLMEAAFDLAASREEIGTVVIGAFWYQYLAQGVALSGSFEPGSKSYVQALANLEAYIKELRGLGKKVFLVSNIPIGSELSPSYMAERRLAKFPKLLLVRDGGLSQGKFDGAFGVIRSDLRKLATAAGASLIDPLDFLCKDNWCPSVDATGEPMYKDAAHLRPSFARANASFMDATVR